MTSRIDSKVLSNSGATPIHDFRPRPCTNRALIHSLYDDRAHSFTTVCSHFAGPAVELLQSFALHLQFHLRILLENVRISLTKHLSHPFIGYASGTQPRGISGTKVVDSEVGNLGPPKSLVPNRLESGLVPALIQIARKQERTIPRDGHLATKGFDGKRSKRNFGGAVWSLRVRDPDDRVLKVHLILLHRSQFLVDSQSRLRNDLHGVFQVLGSVKFDLLLLRPGYVVRPEQSSHGDREFDARTGVRCEQFLSYRHVQHAPEHPKLLVHRGRFENSLLSVTTSELDPNTLPKTPAKVVFDGVGCDIHQFSARERGFQMGCAAHVRLVGFLGS